MRGRSTAIRSNRCRRSTFTPPPTKTTSITTWSRFARPRPNDLRPARRPVHQRDAREDHRRGDHETRGEMLAEQKHAEGDAEDRREKREHRKPRRHIAREQPEPGQIADERDDDRLIRETRDRKRR